MIKIKSKGSVENQCRLCHTLFTYIMPTAGAFLMHYFVKESLKTAQNVFSLELGAEYPDVYIM